MVFIIKTHCTIPVKSVLWLTECTPAVINALRNTTVKIGHGHCIRCKIKLFYALSVRIIARKPEACIIINICIWIHHVIFRFRISLIYIIPYPELRIVYIHLTTDKAPVTTHCYHLWIYVAAISLICRFKQLIVHIGKYLYFLKYSIVCFT